MAIAKFNPLLEGVSGKSGRLVFKSLRGQTVIAQMPETEPPPASTKQLAQRERFSAACKYGRRVLSDPLQRQAYTALARERNRRVDKMIESDFLTPPTVDLIDLAGYRGEARGTIRVLAQDDIEVVGVTIEINGVGGALIESGAATKIHGVWNYTTTTPAPANEAVLITATAIDRPGNRTPRTEVYRHQ